MLIIVIWIRDLIKSVIEIESNRCRTNTFCNKGNNSDNDNHNNNNIYHNNNNNDNTYNKNNNSNNQ